MGQVYDRDLNAPMPDVEIALLDSPFKTYTDSSGCFFIINIPPGIYDVKALYLGYVPAVSRRIPIYIDETAIVNFKLSSTIIELGAHGYQPMSASHD